jgi:hypothetical protein
VTSRDRLTSVDTITEILHDVLCVPAAKPYNGWSPGHMRVDRTRAVKVYDRMVGAGLINAPISISDDFLAVS